MTTIIDAPVEEAVVEPAVEAVEAPAVETQAVDAPVVEAPAEPEAKDWRSEWAGEDAEVLKFLGRHASPAAAIKEFKKIHGDMRAGKFLKPVDENSSDEEKAAWRNALGVPESPDGYLEKLPDGLVIGEDDKGPIEQVLAAMHESGAPKGVVDAMLSSYFDLVESQDAERFETNEAAKRETEDALRSEWGPEYRRNVNVLTNFIGSLPESVGSVFLEAVDERGVKIANNPEFLKWAMSIALDKNPIATVVPGAGANQASAIADEIASIEKTMRTNRSEYNRNDAMQARYRQLLEAREKLS